MSDGPQNGGLLPAPQFLQRLVDGAFDRAQSLEPRRPSLFERPTLDVADTVEHAPDFTLDEDSIRRSAPAGEVAESIPRGRVSPDNDRLIPSRWRADDDRSIESTQQAKGDRAHETVDASLRPAKPVPQRPAERLQGVRDAASVPALLPAKIDMHVESDRTVRPADALVRDTSDVSIVPAPASGVFSRPHSNIDGLDADSHTPLPDRRDGGVLEPIGSVNRDGRRPLHAAAPAVAVPGPVVNVTIGRIEVRVAPAQPSPRRQRSEPPKPMSLDQYLQKRGAQR